MIRVQRDIFDIGKEIETLTNGRTDIGAVVSFTGLVRDFNDGTKVTGLSLEHYPGMTERELSKIEDDARERWNLQDCLIIHRYGDMALGEPIVLVITASPHRQDAFEAAHFLMDWLKTKAPFWKQEMNASGETNWVKERESDLKAAKRWNSDS
ncbi:molybdenum cofactor biosynthesis protein MoaE [Sneathiella sp. HT1-7]|jgi:molybdopterin synthase catalytic subunit|uniref:molybdenum cofactor biosynthesis protein MoaE n=1 Tax=Sneathiella sp. HT1-7 TaxID=2887192 RepID=UPI001D1451E9|nr:molybdenum cofactor biosynthesis protein MoaE [Sneathiella sp. HT1-7]MCC3306696.1 molybdenum cofactor biosynthesis protein MoaE [Sneathiella sp. HT1-7]